MDTIVRGLAIYFALLVIFRLAGRRSLSDASTFDLVLILIVSETVQNALVADDPSVTTAILLVATLVGVDVFLLWLKTHFPRVELVLEGAPLLIVDDGRMLRWQMRILNVDEDDVAEAAREQHGIDELAQVERAYVERTGKITVIPRG